VDEKEKGNDAYKKKDFDTAIAHYKKALDLDPDNMTYHTNAAGMSIWWYCVSYHGLFFCVAAYFEQKNFDACVQSCKDAIETGRRVFADFKLISKYLFTSFRSLLSYDDTYLLLSRAFHRMGNAYTKQEKYQEAVDAYSMALTEHRNADSLQALQKVGKLKAEKDKLSYIDPAKSLEEKNLGNDAFHKGDFPTAVKHYSEAIKRNPEDHVLYSNRAACYTKLGEYILGERDCDKAIELNPTFGNPHPHLYNYNNQQHHHHHHQQQQQHSLFTLHQQSRHTQGRVTSSSSWSSTTSA